MHRVCACVSGKNMRRAMVRAYGLRAWVGEASDGHKQALGADVWVPKTRRSRRALESVSELRRLAYLHLRRRPALRPRFTAGVLLSARYLEVAKEAT